MQQMLLDELPGGTFAHLGMEFDRWAGFRPRGEGTACAMDDILQRRSLSCGAISFVALCLVVIHVQTIDLVTSSWP